MAEVWTLLLANCDVSGTVLAPLCSDIRRLSIASEAEQRLLLLNRLQAYRLESLEGEAGGLLTAYYEPVFEAQRLAGNGFNTPLYATPSGLANGRPWFSRQDIESLPAAQTALRGREIAWLADPVDALILHIQGSGRLRITEADGSVRTVRVGFAASNEQPYQSVGRWLLDKGETRDASWPGIKGLVAAQSAAAARIVVDQPALCVFQRTAPWCRPQRGAAGCAGLAIDRWTLGSYRSAQHALWHAAVVGVPGTHTCFIAFGVGARHGQRHCGSGARRFFHGNRP